MNSPSCISRIEKKKKKQKQNISLPHQSTYSSWLIFPFSICFLSYKDGNGGIFPSFFQVFLGLEALRREEMRGSRVTQKSAYIPGKMPWQAWGRREWEVGEARLVKGI